jgi:hypothetical protein
LEVVEGILRIPSQFDSSICSDVQKIYTTSRRKIGKFDGVQLL